jgi:hypothetical protein
MPVQSETLDRQARERRRHWSAIGAQAHRAIGSINREKILLEKKIDELRTFEREYCTHLKTYCKRSSENSMRTDPPPHPQTRCAPHRTW